MNILSEALEYQACGKLAEAKDKFSEVVRLEPNNTVAHYSLAAINASLGAHDRALDHIDEAIRINPTFAPSYLARSKINVLLERLPQAFGDAERALSLDPSSAENLAQRDNLRVGRYDGIAAVIEKLKGHPLFAHVTLTRSERSPIAAMVTEMLEELPGL